MPRALMVLAVWWWLVTAAVAQSIGPAPVIGGSRAPTPAAGDAAPEHFVPEPPAPSAVSLPVAIARGGIVVLAERGLERDATRLASTAEASLERIAADLPGLPQPSRIEIRLVRDGASMSDAAGRATPPWAAGVAFPASGLIVVTIARGGQPVSVDQTLVHELAHLALGAALGDKAPRWLHEGFAWQHSPEIGWDRTETLAGMAWFGSAIPLDEIERAFPAEELPASRAYAQSYDLVTFLARRGRWEDRDDDGDRWPFRRFLRYLASGDDLDRAAHRAYGRSMPQLFAEWQEQLKDRYLLFPLALFVSFLWVVASLLLVAAFLRRRRQVKRRLGEWAVEEARAAAAAAAAAREGS